MLRLVLFDVARLLPPGRGALERGWVRGLGALPNEDRKDLALDDRVLRARALELAAGEVEERLRRDRIALLTIFSALAIARGFGPVTWKETE